MPVRMILLLCAVLPLMAAPRQSNAALVLQQDLGTVYETTAIGNSDTTAANMAGMEVIVEFVNATIQTATWTASGASGTGWSLTQGPGTTFSNEWTLTNSGLLASGIRRMTINGRPGNTIFDRATAMSTAGSSTGTDLTEPGLFPISGSQDVTVTYQDAVALTGDPIVGDVWSVLNIEFENGLGGLLPASFSFIQDTDNILISGDLTARTPEPASLALMGVAGLMIGVRRSRRRRRSSDTA